MLKVYFSQFLLTLGCSTQNGICLVCTHTPSHHSLYFLFTELSLSAHFQIKLELIMLLFLSVFSLSLLAAFELMELFPSQSFCYIHLLGSMLASAAFCHFFLQHLHVNNQTESHIFYILLNTFQSHTKKMVTFIIPRLPVTIFVTA